MAKFAPQDEKPFNPITDKLLQAVSGAAPATTDDAGEAVLPVRTPREASSKGVHLQTPTMEDAEDENAERLTRQMRYQATPTEELETKEFLRRFSLAAGTSLTHSNLMRACRDLVLQVEEKLVDGLCRKFALLRQNLKIVFRKINDLCASTFLFSVICDRAPELPC